MSDTGKDLSRKIMEAVKPLLPQKTAFIMVFASKDDGDMGVVCNVPDNVALILLKEGIKSINDEPPVEIDTAPIKSEKELN
jgi:hypothetical protein